MLIYFITNNKKKKEAEAVLDLIKDLSHKVIIRVIGGKNKSDLPEKFDMLIAEIRDFSTEINYQVVLSLIQKKPVLCIYPEGSNVPKNLPPAKGTIAKNLTLKSYNRHSLHEVIKEFIESVDQGGKAERFNFFLTPDLKEYVNWVPFGRGTTRSGFIRQLIRDQMKNDENYRTFTKKKK